MTTITATVSLELSQTRQEIPFNALLPPEHHIAGSQGHFWLQHHACFDFKTSGTLRDAPLLSISGWLTLGIDVRNLGHSEQKRRTTVLSR
jgi:hypothetical protein